MCPLLSNSFCKAEKKLSVLPEFTISYIRLNTPTRKKKEEKREKNHFFLKEELKQNNKQNRKIKLHIYTSSSPSDIHVVNIYIYVPQSIANNNV
jgi:hypothetical protein